MPKKNRTPYSGDMQGFLAGRPKMRANYNNASEADKTGFRNAMESGGGKAGKQYMKNTRNRIAPPGSGQYTTVPGEQNNYDLETTPGIANTQELFNQQNALFNETANSIDQEGPGGGVEYEIGPNGERRAKYNMSEGMQKMWDTAQNQGPLKFGDGAPKAWENTYNASAPTGYNTQQFDPNAQGSPAKPWEADYNTQRTKAEQSVMDKFNRQNEPRLAQEKEQLKQQLANEGADADSPRYRKLMGELEQKQSNFRLDAQAEAMGQGRQEQAQGFGQGVTSRNLYGQEQAQGFGQGVAGTQLGMQQQGQQFNQQLQGRGQYTGEQAQEWGSPYSQLNSMVGAQSGMMGSYQPAGMVNKANTDVTSPAISMFQMGPYAQQQYRNQMGLLQQQGNQQLQQIKEGAIMAAGAGGIPPGYN